MASLKLIRDTSYGPVNGFADTHPLRRTSSALEAHRGPGGGEDPVLKWLGIPYAQAGRFERPSTPETWQEPKECLEFGSMFPQPPSNTELLLAKLPGFLMRTHIPVSESSHFVNVFAPGDLKEGEKLPVLVWIYGGALNNGTADRFFYDPTCWIRDGQKRGQRCIVVTGNYRTNIFGFCASDDLAKADLNGLCGNYGAYDVIAMFEWVKSNIANFGGDPQNVTAFGQSAGAFLISHLLVSGKRLFRRAICQSGAAETMLLRPVPQAYPAYASIIESIRVPSTASPSERLAALRNAPAETLLSLHNASHSFTSLSLALEPKVEGAIWTEGTLKRFDRGEWDEWVEEVILGTTEDEGTIFASAFQLTSPQAFDTYVSRFPLSLQPKIKAKYTSHLPNRTYDSSFPIPLTAMPGSKLFADQVFLHPVMGQVSLLARKSKVWLYRLRAPVEVIDRVAPVKLDVPLGGFATAAAVGERWMRFAIEGNPDPSWAPYTPAKPSWLAVDRAGKVSNEDLSCFEKEKVELVFAGQEKSEGEEFLGESNE
ncbi:carboxylesterase type B [Rhodotorula toruloides]|uniref:Carboxylesterase type B n=1 Tax=Rhodotorula toruloides TaxID=5286 RepID=A0A511KJ54_RHOTO|nr:carboxylesterase type B [Rhodotorula toruloides]